MSKESYIKGLKFCKENYSSLRKTELIIIRDKYIRKFKNIELFKNPCSRYMDNRLDYYCGCVDYLNTLLRNFI